MLHQLLQEQIRQHLGDPQALPENYHRFLEAISNTYGQYVCHTVGTGAKETGSLCGELRRVLENVDEVVFSKDLRTSQYAYISPSCEKIYGYSVSEFMANTSLWKEVIHPDDAGLIRPFDNITAATGELRAQFRIIHKDGSVRWLSSRLIPVPGEAGKPILIDVVVNDITEAKVTQQELFEAHGELNRLFNNINEVLFSVDMRTARLTHISTACEKVYGYTTSDFFTNPDLWQSVIYPDDKSIAQQHVQDLQQGRQVINRYRIIHKNGSLRWIENRITPGLDADGQVVRIDGVTSDITDKVTGEQKLKHNEKMMSDAQRMAHLGSWELDLANTDDLSGNMLIWSDEVFRILGYDLSTSRASVSNFLKVVHPADAERVQAAMRKAISERSNYAVDHRILHENGGVRWIKAEAAIVTDDGDGGRLKMVGTLQDITERKEMEEKLRKSEVNLTAIIENTDAYIYSLDREFRYITFNSLLKKTMQQVYDVEIKPGMKIFGYLDKVDQKEANFWKSTYTKALTGEAIQFVKEYDSAGAKSHLEFFINPIIENGQVIGLSCSARNITRQRMAEVQLLKSEANLQTIFDHTETIYVLLDKDLNILSFNAAASYWAKHELNVEYREGDPLMMYLGRDRHDDMKRIARLVLKGETVHYESDYPQPDGSVNYYAVSVRPILDSQRGIQGICLSSNNITARKRSEQSLQKSEANLRTILQHTDNAYLLIGPDLKIISLNQKAIDFAVRDLGKMPEEGRDVISYFPKERQVPLKKMMQSIVGNNTLHYEYEISYPQKDLSTVWYHVQLFGVSGSNKEVSGVMMTLTDVSETKAVADKIRLSEERYRLVSENAVLGVAWGRVDGTLLKANRAFCKMLDYTEEELLSKHFSKYTHPEDVTAEMGFIRQMLDGTINHYQMEKRLLTKHGDVIWVESNASCVKNEMNEIQFVIVLMQDITLRKDAEQSLKESEERYRQIVETAQEGIWMLDSDNRTVFVNKKMTEIFGYPANEMMGLQLFDFMDNEGKVMAVKAIKKRGRELAENQEFRFLTKQGNYIWTNLSTTAITDEAGQYKGALAMVTDITYRKQAEEALHKSEANLRNILENTDTAYVLLDEKVNILSFNMLAQKLAKNELHDTITEGRNYIDMMKPDRRREVEKIIKRVLGGEKPVSYEVKYTKKNKVATWLHVTMHPIFNASKKLQGMSIAATDITKRKAADEALHKSEANLRTIFNNTTVSYVLMDVNLRIVSFNQRAAKGYKKELGKPLAEGKYFLDYLPEERKTAAKKLYEAVLQGEKISYETDYPGAGGQLSWYNMSLFPVSNGEDSIYGMIIASEDITDRKRTELERETMTADIIQRNKDLEQFAYIISHNLRSPVANILGLSNIIQYTPSLSKDDLDKCLAGLFSSVKKLDEVIIDLNYILQVRREINEKKEVVRFSRIISDIQVSIDNLVKKEKVTIITNFNDVDYFFTLKSYLNSIFYNLISNSIKYRIPDTPPVIEIRSKKLKNRIQILYKDNGLGIDLVAHGDKIFGLYKKFHLHTEGKGMGLYMVKTQVGILDGKISVKSEKNKGVEFLIEFTTPDN